MKKDISIKPCDYSQKEIRGITELIKSNLDKNFSEDFFRWKHIDNPFGKSYGLLAIHEGRIVGLRLFMYWEFVQPRSFKIVKAIRPVDTVVDKSYRGLGLFKKLTLQGLEDCQDKFDLVFNTPNNNSLPGYLKMGWSKIELNDFFETGIVNIFKKGCEIREVTLEEISPLNLESANFITNKHLDYLKWRYKDSQYKTVIDGPNIMIYSLRKLRGLNQLIIQEYFGDKIILEKMLITLCKLNKTILTYFYNNEKIKWNNYFCTFQRKKAVVVNRDDNFEISHKICFSLGDLEGRL